MVSTLRESDTHGRADGSNKVKVTILASEWGSSKGGLSTLNRELAIQLAKFPEVETTFFLPQCSQEDKQVAFKHNIKIVEATRRPGYEELEWLSFPPEHLQIDVIIGHGVKLGHQAQVIRDSKKCTWVQVVHTDPEELGMFKNYPIPISKGEQKHKTEVELCEMADLVIGVGPKLSEAFRSYLRGCQKDQNILDFTPGVFEEFLSVKQVPEERKQCRVLVFGRGDAEDFGLKGFDIAGKAVAELSDTRLVFVGAPDGKHEEIAGRLTKCGVPANRLRVRGFEQSRESLRRLFQEVDLVLMPSRTEGFGLTGLEALSAGLPVLVSQNSGFGEALNNVPFGSSFVIDSEDPKDWAAAIKKIWNKDRKKRLEEAEAVRDSYAKKYNWAKQIKDVLDKMTLVLDESSGNQSSSQTRGRMISSAVQVSPWTEDNTVNSAARSIFPDVQKMQCDTDKVNNKTNLPVDLRKMALDKGFTISDNYASGNCMFYALSDQLQSVKEIQTSHRELRKTVVQFLTENANMHDGTPLFNFVSAYPSWTGYLESMAKDGTWGDHLVLHAVANYFQTHIRIISSLGRDILVSPEIPVVNTNPLVLGHVHELHYVSLQPKQVVSASYLSSTQRKRQLNNGDLDSGTKVRKTGDDSMASINTDLSHPAHIIERIRQFYKTREERVLPLPWCEHFSFHLNDIFTRLKIVSKEKTRGELNDETTNMTAIFKAHADCQKPRTVLIEGEPGMGKTTYCQKLAYDWATKQEQWDASFPEIEVLLLLKCREIEIDVWKAIDEQILPLDIDDEAKESFFKFVCKNQSKVMLVLDGMDEADPKKLAMYFNLVESKELPGCHIVLTSRHEAGMKVRRYCDSLWEIVGFTTRDAWRYIHKYFKNMKDLAEELIAIIWFPDWDKLGASYSLKELTQNPLNTALLCVVWEDFKGVFPTSRTQLYIEIVHCVLRRYETKYGLSSKHEDLISVYKDELKHLGRIALQALRKGELYFEEHEFDGNSIVLSKFGFLSIHAGSSKRKPSLRYSFLHKSFQEFFAGLYLAFQIHNREIDCDSVVTDQICSNELQQVFLFMSGILASQSEEAAVSLVKSITVNINLISRASDGDVIKHLDFALRCISECRTNEGNIRSRLLHTLGVHLDIKTLNVKYKMRNILLFFEALAANSSLTNLDLSRNRIGPFGADSLSQALARNSSLTILDLSYNEIGPSGAASLSQVLAANSSLTTLDLSYSKIGPSGAASLSQALAANSLTNLNLLASGIGSSGAASFSQALAANSSLTNLDLSRNVIGPSGADSLSQALAANSSLTTLDLSCNKIGPSGAASLSQALAANSSLTNLNLLQTRIGSSGAASLSQALAANSSLTNLDLSGNRIGPFGADSLSQALAANSSLTTLDLSYNKIGPSGAASLSQALAANSSLTNLNLTMNKIGFSSVVALDEACKINTTVKVYYGD